MAGGGVSSQGRRWGWVADPDRVVQHRPDRCAGPACGADLSGGREYGRQRRQVVELPDPQPVVTEYQLIAVESRRRGGWARSSPG